MLPTHFGVLVAACAIVMLWRSSTLAMLRLVMLFSLMGGSAALVLTGLGGSTVQPAVLALGFLVLRCVLPGPGQSQRFQLAANDAVFLAIFALYGAAGAMILPRIFAGVIDVTPLRPLPSTYIYAAYPVAFSSQNITTAVYLLVTMLAAVCAHAAAQAEGAERGIARTAAVVGATHALLGLSGVILAGTAWAQVLGFFRNGFYAQLDQSFDGIVRMNGIWPEPAAFSAYGFAWLVLIAELWLRDVERRWTGPAASLLALALVVSTSTTAYVGLACYGLLVSLRLVFLPGAIPAAKALIFVAGGLAGLAGVLALLVLSPATATAMRELIAMFTVSKASSLSGLQRAFWAKQGIDAFVASYGLGVGPGSFRSSSIVTAILGSTGVAGSIALLLHLTRVFKPLHRSSYVRLSGNRQSVGVAASWAAVVMLIPASVSAASPDPGLVWGMFCGIALAMRRPRQGDYPVPDTNV